MWRELDASEVRFGLLVSSSDGIECATAGPRWVIVAGRSSGGGGANGRCQFCNAKEDGDDEWMRNGVVIKTVRRNKEKTKLKVTLGKVHGWKARHVFTRVASDCN